MAFSISVLLVATIAVSTTSLVDAAPSGTWAVRSVAIDTRYTFAEDVNNNGAMVGRAGGPGGLAFFDDAAGRVTMLGTLGGYRSIAWALNDAEVVVGEAETPGGAMHAFRWTAATGMTDLGTLGGTGSAAYDINSSGLIVGQADTATGDKRAVLWDPVTGIKDLGAAGPGKDWRANGVNDSGIVVGWGLNGVNNLGVVWDPNAATAVFLPTLAGPPLTSSAVASKINNAGTIVGSSYNGVSHAVRWPDLNTIEDLDTAPKGSVATAVSADGTVVGTRYDSAGLALPFVVPAWGPSLMVLPTLGREAGVTSINDRGVAVGGAITGVAAPSTVGAVWTFTEDPPLLTTISSTSTSTTVPVPVPVPPASAPAQVVPAVPSFTG